VVITIPFAFGDGGGVAKMAGHGQTINIMTLGGLALACGRHVDEGTVLMENIHCIWPREENKAQAVLSQPAAKLRSHHFSHAQRAGCLSASFFIAGLRSRSLCRCPLRWVLDGCVVFAFNSLVPCAVNWKAEKRTSRRNTLRKNGSIVFRKRFQAALERIMKFPKLLLGAYAGVFACLIIGCLAQIGGGDLPVVGVDPIPLRIGSTDGTRVAV